MNTDGTMHRIGNLGLLREARKYHTCGTFKTAIGANAGFAVGGLGYNSQLTETELNTAEMYYPELGKTKEFI